MKIKKWIIIFILTRIIWLWTTFSAENFPYSNGNDPVTDNVDLNFSETLKSWLQDDQNILSRLLWYFMPNSAIYMSDNWHPSILTYLKSIVNLLLSFVSLIALILLIFAFYMIFFRKDDAGVKTAIQMIKWIVIALVIIWLSWIIVSFLYRFQNENTQLSYNYTQNIQNNISETFKI